MNRQGALSCADDTVQEDLLRRFRPSLRVALQDDYSSSLVRLEWTVGRAQGFELASFATPKGLAFASTAWQHVLCSAV